MNAILTVFLKEFRENLRDRRTLLSALILGPLLGPMLFAAALSLNIQQGTVKGDRPVSLAVSHAERAPNLLAFLHEYGVNIKNVSVDAADARSAIRAHRETLVLLIDEQFGKRLDSGEPAPLELYADSSDPSNGRNLGRVRVLLEQYGVQISRLRIQARGIDPTVLSPIVVQDVGCLDAGEPFGAHPGHPELSDAPHYVDGRTEPGDRYHRR